MRGLFVGEYCGMGKLGADAVVKGVRGEVGVKFAG